VAVAIAGGRGLMVAERPADRRTAVAWFAVDCARPTGRPDCRIIRTQAGYDGWWTGDAGAIWTRFVSDLAAWGCAVPGVRHGPRSRLHA
jgi:hypothetical protein